MKETRAWWRRTLLAILLTIALAVLINTALALMFYGSRIAEAIANHYGFGNSAKRKVEVRNSVTHTLTVAKVREWLQRGVRTPKEAVLKERLRALFT